MAKSSESFGIRIWTYLDPLFKYLKFRYLRICFVCCVVSLERSIVSRASFRSRSRLHFVFSLGSVCRMSDTVRRHLHIFTSSHFAYFIIDFIDQYRSIVNQY